MADLELGVPEILGLSDEQKQRLAEKVSDQLVEIIEGTQAEAIIAAKPKVKSESVSVKVKAQS